MNSNQMGDGSPILVLPEALTLRAASPLAQQLLEMRGRPLVVDASQVEKISTPCLQVLLSAHATWARDNLTFGLFRPSQALLEALRILGIPIEKIGEWEPAR
jgi:chemotaxis protein CheX